MKKLLLILLCVPLIGIGQINVVNSSATTVIGELNGKERNQVTETIINNECLGVCLGIRIEKKDNTLRIIYQSHHKNSSCENREDCSYLNSTPTIQIFTVDTDGRRVGGTDCGSNIIEIKDNGSTLNDLFNLIKDEFNALDKKEVKKCKDDKWNIIRKLELDIGQTDLLILEWIGGKEDGQMRFDYQNMRSFWLDIVDIKKLFDKK